MKNKINVFLDLDNTIINSLDLEELTLINPKFKTEPLEFEKKFKYADMILDDVFEFRVYARPNLEEFLDFLFEHFNVCIWTAADSDYAMFIIDNFIETKPNRKVDLIFYRYHLELSENRYGEGHIKDLRFLWEFIKHPNILPCNTILIDDLIDVKLTNPDNVIKVQKFDMTIYEDELVLNYNIINDNVLLGVKEQLTKMLHNFNSDLCQTLTKSYKSRFIPSLILLD